MRRNQIWPGNSSLFGGAQQQWQKQQQNKISRKKKQELPTDPRTHTHTQAMGIGNDYGKCVLVYGVCLVLFCSKR